MVVQVKAAGQSILIFCSHIFLSLWGVFSSVSMQSGLQTDKSHRHTKHPCYSVAGKRTKGFLLTLGQQFCRLRYAHWQEFSRQDCLLNLGLMYMIGNTPDPADKIIHNFSTVGPRTERFLGPERTRSVQKSFNFFIQYRFYKIRSSGGIFTLLCSKIRSLQEFLYPIEIRSAERPVQLEVVQFEALLYQHSTSQLMVWEVFTSIKIVIFANQLTLSTHRHQSVRGL